MDSCRVGSSLAEGRGGGQTDCEPAHHAIRSWQDCVPGNVVMTASASQRTTICFPLFLWLWPLPPPLDLRFLAVFRSPDTHAFSRSLVFTDLLGARKCSVQYVLLGNKQQHKCGGLVWTLGFKYVVLHHLLNYLLSYLLIDTCYEASIRGSRLI